tara:strand:+ start:14334 stop:17645 length:3312 start_codon:yes stop_codon:yes gene_type:complete
LKTNDLNNIHSNLNAFIRRYYLRDIYKGFIITFSGGISLLTLFAVAEYFFRFSSNARLFLLVSFTLIFLISFFRFLALPFLRFLGIIHKISEEQASKLIGKYFTDVNDQLTNLLQLEKSESNELTLASIDQKAKKIAPFEFKKAVSFRDVFKMVKWSFIPLAVVMIISLWNAKIITKGTERIVNFNQTFVPENPYKFKIVNTHFSVLRNDQYTFQIEFTGEKVPHDVYIIENNKQYRFSKKSMSVFEFVFRNVQKPLRFQVNTGGYLSNYFQLNLIEKPAISNFSVALNFPAYTKKKRKVLHNNGDLFIPEGTEIKWLLKSHFVDQVIFTINDSLSSLSPVENRIIFKTQALSSFNYSITPKNTDGILGDKMDYSVNVIKDNYPQIKVKNIQDSIHPFFLFHSGLIADDYGFKSLRFCFQNNDTSGFIPIPVPTTEFQYSFNHGINIKELGFEAGSNFSYYFEVFDNDAVNGSKSTKSTLQSYDIPSKKDIEELLANNRKSIKNQLDQNMNEVQNLQKEYEDLQKMMSSKKKMDWQDKARLEQFMNHQNQLKNQLEQLQFDQEKNNYQKDQLSPLEETILKKQEQINKLFEELMDEETKKLFEELEKLLENFQEEKIKETLEEMNLSNEALEKELDRTLEMFKQLEFDQKLEETIEKLDQLAKKQEEASEETRENKELTKEELQEKQKNINKEFEEIQHNIEELQQQNEELEYKRNFERSQDQQEEIKQDQQKSEEEIQNNNTKKASKSQKNAAEKMKKLSEQMKKMQQDQKMEQQMEDMNSLRQILENLISLSVEQEDLMKKIKTTNRFDPRFPVLATTQGNLKESAKIIEDSLLALSKRQISLQTIVNKEILDIKYNMDKSIDFLRERKNYNAAMKQQYVMTAANNLALLLDESLQQMQEQMRKQQGGGNCTKPGGAQPKPGSIQNIKQMQKQLSEQMQKMMKELQNGKKPGKQGKNGKNGLAKSLAQMAAQQNAIKEQLKKLQEENKKQGGGLGDLKSLLDQLDQNERDILNKNISRETILRQQEIMSKLLKAENAQRERELDKKRISKKGINTFKRNPEDFSSYETFELKEKEAIKTIPSSFNLYYKKKISEYFNKFDE